MKKLLLLIPVLFLFFGTHLKAQSMQDTADYPYWINMMQYDTVNFFKVQRAFYQYYNAHKDEDAEKQEAKEGKEEEGGLEIFKRWEYMTSRRIQPDGTRLKPDQIITEYNNYVAKHNSSAIKSAIKGGAFASGSNPTGSWKSIGPQNVPTDRVYQVDGMGRINAIAFHPTAKGTIYVGAPDGGLWVSTDTGATWTTKTDGLASLGVSAIAVNPLAPTHIFIGTGDRDNNDATGLGVWKSVNGGTSWAAFGTGMGNVVVSKLLIDPKDTTIMLAATSTGIYRTTNGGGKWTKTSSTTGFYKDMVFKPNHPNVVYASAGGSFFRSTNNGVSWSQISGLGSNFRGVIAVTAADTNRVYFLTSGTTTFSACYISTDGGSTFRTKCTSPNILGYSDNGSTNDGQAFYDFCAVADTAHAGTLYVGGINIFKSTDSGSTWTAVAHWVGSGLPNVHADLHVMAINPLNNRLYAGEDGGIVYSPNGGTNWYDISNGLAITEIYKIGQSASRPDMMLMGAQDNGTAQFAKKSWYSVLGGDGMTCAIDPKDTNYQYAEIYYGQIYRSKDAGQSFSVNIAGKGVGGITEQGPWVTQYMLSYANSKEMFAGYNNVWKCSNLAASTPSWTQISNSLGSSNTALIQAIDQSPVDTNTFYISRDDNTLFISSNVNASTPSWTNLTSKLPVSGAVVTAIRTHPKYANVVYIVQNSDVYVSINYGSTWTKITGSLPSVPKNVIAIDKNSYSGLYVGTDAGVYYMDSTMTDWTPFYSGLPAEPRILDLAIYYDPSNSANNFISAGSFGRGAWQSTLFSPVNPTAKFGVNNYTQCLNNNSFVFTDSSTIASGYLSWSWDFGDSKNAYTENPTHTYAAAGTYTVKLIVTSTLGTTSTISKKVTVNQQASPLFTINTLNQCLSGNRYSFTDKSTTSSGTMAWSWDFGDGVGKSTSENPTYSYKKAGTDTVKLTVTTNSGCPALISKTVIVYPQPADSFSVNNAGQCFRGNRFVYTNSTTISSGSISSWKWKYGNGDSSTSKSPTYSYSKAGVYKIKLTAVSNFGCSTADSQSISVYPQISPSFTINAANQCIAGNKFIFSDKSTLSSGSITTWIWQFGDGHDTSTENPIHTYDSTGNFRVKVFMTTDNSCNDTISQIVAVYPQPKSSFTIKTATQCLKYNRFSFADQSVASTGNVIVGWNWKFGDSTTSSSTNPFHTFGNSGTYIVSLIVSDSNKCTDSSAKTVTLLPKIKAMFKANDSVQCFESNNFIFSDQSTLPSGTNYWSWNFGDNQHATSQNPAHSYSNPGTYKVGLIVTNADGCKDTIYKTVVVHSKITPKFSAGILKQCLKGNSYVITDSSSISSGGISSKIWNFGDGNSSKASDPVYSYKNPGIYHITLTLKSDQGCFDSTKLTVTVNPTPAPFIFGDTVICAKGSANYLSTNDPGSHYLWVISGGKITSKTDSTNNITANWPVSDTGNLILVETNIYGCVDSDFRSVMVNPLPTAKFGAANHNNVCAGAALSFIDSSTNASRVFWLFGDGSNDSKANPSHVYAKAGKYIARQIVTNSYGCADTTSRNITVNAMPGAHWVADSLNRAKIVFIAQDTSFPASDYAWDLGDGTKLSGHRLTHIFPSNKQYIVKLIVTSAAGCIQEYDSTLNVTISGIVSENAGLNNFSLNIYPNPFRNSTNVDYNLNSDSKVKIMLYNLEGKLISQVADQKQTAGRHKFEIDGGKLGLRAGTYLVKVYVNDAFVTKNIIKL